MFKIYEFYRPNYMQINSQKLYYFKVFGYNKSMFRFVDKNKIN